MTFRLTFLFVFIFALGCVSVTFGQAESVIGQISNSTFESFAGSMSGNGRFVVFESNGDLATVNPRNSDNNNEIFLFDYAQRRIFQITDTKSVLFDTSLGSTFTNIRVIITNVRPVISNDGRWIAFSSNATTSTPAVPDSTNPGSFDGNAYTSPTPSPSPSVSPTPTLGDNPLTQDANLEMWLYEIPAYASVTDLSAGDEYPLMDLSGGTFIRVTNTPPSQLPRSATTTTGAFVADDNHDASISDDGSVIAFASTRDLVPSVGNPFPTADNEEIFTFVRTAPRRGKSYRVSGASAGVLGQVTMTPRGPITDPIYNKNPTISGNGSRVAFASTGDNPIVGMTGGVNPATSRNEEIFYSDLDITGSPTGVKKQVTETTPTNAGDIVNVLDIGRRMSRDGRYIAFDSFADLANENMGTNYTSYALYLYDTTTSTFRRILARSDADSAATGGDVARYPGFTDTDANGTPSTLVLETRMNIKPDGTIPTDPAEGLNNFDARQSQIYSYPLDAPAADAIFTRLTRLPVPAFVIASTQPLTSNSLNRVAFNLAVSELGLGNADFLSEVYYMLTPTVTNTAPISVNFATGASFIPVSATALPTPSATPTPSPSPTPSATPTPSPSPTPTGSPTPTPTPTPEPTPTPQTPTAVFGISTGMQVIMGYQAGFDRPVVVRNGVGSLKRAFTLPIELSGISVTINGAACGLKYVSRHRIDFVVPPALSSAVAGTELPLVIHNNGVQYKTLVTLVPSRPDIFRNDGQIDANGRSKVFNVTNRVHTTEPFTVTTNRVRPFGKVPSILRLYMTGIQGVTPTDATIRIGAFGSVLVPVVSDAILVEPGVYTLDFTLPPELDGAGDQPIIVTISVGGMPFTSRLDDTATRFRIL